MMRRSAAAAQFDAMLDGFGNVGLGGTYCLRQLQPLGQVRRQTARERAACAMRILRRDALAGEPCFRAAVKE